LALTTVPFLSPFTIPKRGSRGFAIVDIMPWITGVPQKWRMWAAVIVGLVLLWAMANYKGN